MLYGCVIPPKNPVAVPTPTATATPEVTPTPRKTLPPTIAPFPIPTVDATEFELVEIPTSVKVGQSFVITAKAKEHDSVNVFVDQYQIGKMLWDDVSKMKYLKVNKLSSAGQREVSFVLNGVKVRSVPLEVTK